MGNNGKDKQQNTSIEISTKNGVIETVQILTPHTESKIDYHGYALGTNDKYVYDQKDLDISLKGTPKEQAGFPKKDITADNMTKSVTDFILKNNQKNIFSIKIDGTEVSYEKLCKSLEKSQMLLAALGIVKEGQRTFYSHAASGNKNTADIEKFGTPGAKAVFEEIKKLSKNGTVPIAKDKEDYLQKLGNKFSDIEIYIGTGNFVQIIQDRGYENHIPKGPNYACFDVSYESLRKLESEKPHATAPVSKPKGAVKTL